LGVPPPQDACKPHAAAAELNKLRSACQAVMHANSTLFNVHGSTHATGFFSCMRTAYVNTVQQNSCRRREAPSPLLAIKIAVAKRQVITIDRGLLHNDQSIVKVNGPLVLAA